MALSRITLTAALPLFALAGCADFDMDMRSLGNGLDTSEAALQATAPRPEPDARGVLSYPSYQVAIARRGDTVGDVAARVGVPVEDLARFNGLRDGVRLRGGETLVLPRRVADAPGGTVDVAAVAGSAIARAGGIRSSVIEPAGQSGSEPRTHRVQPGETAFSIARRYQVTPRALADWNGLGEDFAVREGQFLLIPVVLEVETAAVGPIAVERPGTGSVAPEPPSAATALPVEDETPPAAAPVPASPQMAAQKTDDAKFVMPVSGSIMVPYEKGKSDEISISADAGTAVRAADAGTVAAITVDTNGVPIVVIKHVGEVLTVYAGIDDLVVKKGDKVSRGQTIAKVRAGSPSFLQFGVREQFESVDPFTYLN